MQKDKKTGKHNTFEHKGSKAGKTGALTVGVSKCTGIFVIK